ncbi:MAG: thiamine pyrophosphate-dependent dehydrogenase E1 component subunit alpha [Myxococcota bacterium]
MKTKSHDLRGVPSSYQGKAPAMDAQRVYRLMVTARALEERLIKMSKSSDGYFWIGGPGEEAFNIPLGLLVHKGRGPAYDYLHLHYRSSAILLAMGAEPKDFIRQMASKATDPFSAGRNFINHPAVADWNVMPGSSTIETQYSVAPGTALAQLRHGGKGMTIVNGGDAGTAEGDFATCLNWSSRPGRELPILILVVNNKFGISTPFDEVHGDRIIVRRAEPFGIRWDVVDGNDPEASWAKLWEASQYVRNERRPFALEAFVSRLHGHSSSSGGARVDHEPDPLTMFEEKLVHEGHLSAERARELKGEAAKEMLALLSEVRKEPGPSPESIFDHTFVES